MWLQDCSLWASGFRGLLRLRFLTVLHLTHRVREADWHVKCFQTFIFNSSVLEGCLIVFYHERGQGTETLASDVLTVQSGRERCRWLLGVFVAKLVFMKFCYGCQKIFFNPLFVSLFWVTINYRTRLTFHDLIRDLLWSNLRSLDYNAMEGHQPKPHVRGVFFDTQHSVCKLFSERFWGTALMREHQH